MQTIVISLISNFEFTIPEGAKRVLMDRSGLMSPIVEGERDRGAQMPLRISPLSIPDESA
jgi:hypothetical protein